MATVERLYRLKRKFDLDPDTLHCPICTEALSAPVFQCQNGHTACGACCKRIRKGCPSCSKPIGNNRNIAVEKIIESLLVSCKYAHQGCGDMQKYTKRKEHEDLCRFRPCQCPVSGCLHESPKHTLARHIAEKHNVALRPRDPSSRSVTFTMKATDLFAIVEGDNGDLFLVHHEVRKSLGDAFFVTSFSAPSISYYLTVQIESESKFFAMETSAHDIQREADWKHDFLLVPHKPNSQVIRQFAVELWLTDQDSADNYASEDLGSE